jgi:hypothetical protein
MRSARRKLACAIVDLLGNRLPHRRSWPAHRERR